MTIEILMPALSPTMTEGTLAKWHKGEGDEVAPGDVIAEIETDKATMEVEAVDGGRVGKILVAEGTDAVQVNQILAVLLEDGEDAAALEKAVASAATAPGARARSTVACRSQGGGASRSCQTSRGARNKRRSTNICQPIGAPAGGKGGPGSQVACVAADRVDVSSKRMLKLLRRIRRQRRLGSPPRRGRPNSSSFRIRPCAEPSPSG